MLDVEMQFPNEVRIHRKLNQLTERNKKLKNYTYPIGSFDHRKMMVVNFVTRTRFQFEVSLGCSMSMPMHEHSASSNICSVKLK